MSTHMVRKQIYIYKRQEEWLKRLSKYHGISEAELIRQAIDNTTDTQIQYSQPYGQTEWEKFLKFIEERKKLPVSGEPVKWNREEIYEERLYRLMK